MKYGIIILFLFGIYGFIPTIYKKMVWKKGIINNNNEIYLTFDDGPSEYTSELLDILLDNKVKASFFVVADFAEKNPALIRRMKEEGHTIGLHSKEHKSILYRGVRYTSYDFIESFQILENMGYNIDYYRPPWGQFNIISYYLMKKNKKNMIFWNVMAEDWKKDTSKDQIEYKLNKRIKSGSVICLHDGRGENNAPRKTLDALYDLIPSLLQEGYKFKTIEEHYGK